MASTNIGLRIPDALLAKLDRRAPAPDERAATIRRDLEFFYGLLTEYDGVLAARAGNWDPEWALRRDMARYYALIARGRAEARAAVSREEIRAIADVLNGILHEPWSMPLLPHEIEEALQHENLAARHGVDGNTLVEKLTHLSAGATWALIDACERFWNQVGDGNQPDPMALLEEPSRPEVSL